MRTNFMMSERYGHRRPWVKVGLLLVFTAAAFINIGVAMRALSMPVHPYQIAVVTAIETPETVVLSFLLLRRATATALVLFSFRYHGRRKAKGAGAC